MIAEPKARRNFDEILAFVHEAIREVCAEPDRHIIDTHRLDAHIEDSLALAELAFHLETKYNVEISKKDLRPGSLVREIADSIFHELIGLKPREVRMRQETTLHRSGEKKDTNDQVVLEATMDAKGTPHVFRLLNRGNDELATVKFAGLNELGHTNETHLASVLFRLEKFQAGPHACPENIEAIDGIQKALAALQRRTRNRIQQGVEGTYVSHKPEPTAEAPKEKETAAKPVRRVNGNGADLIIGGTRLPMAPLRTQWKPWSDVEAALKRLPTKPTREEWEFLEAVAESSAAKNGLTETQAALERSHAV